jgi:hypothetical protein
MPQLLDKVTSNIQCCGIGVAFTGTSVQSTISGWQPFYNQTFVDADFQKAYAGIASISFSEEGATTAPGTSYKQKTQFRFPATDANRANRIALLHTIKFIKVKLNNGGVIVLGRNDIDQNTLPIVKTQTDEHFCVVSVETQSISPAGFTPNITQFGLPVFIPFTL